MTVFFLKVFKDIRDRNCDSVKSMVTNFGKVGFLDCGDHFVDYHRLNSKDLAE